MNKKYKFVLYLGMIGIGILSLSGCGVINAYNQKQGKGVEQKEIKWYAIDSGGTKPKRYIIYVNNGSLLRSSWMNVSIFVDPATKKDTPRNTVIKVLESKSGPDRIEYTLDFICSKQQMRVTEQETSWRNNRSKKTNSKTWRSPKAGWEERAMQVSCDTLPLDPELFHPELMSPNYPSTAFHMTLYTWKNHWADNKHPGYTTTKSKAQVEKELKASMADFEATLNRGQAMTSNALTKQANQIAQDEDMARRKKQRSSGHSKYFNRDMEGWIGQPESNVIATYGNPGSVSMGASSKTISYTLGGKQLVYANGNTVDNFCIVHFIIVNGKVYDFESTDFCQ